MRIIRLVLISASALTRSGITQFVARASPPIEVIGAFPDLLNAQTFLREHPVDVILVVESWPRHPALVSEVSALRAEQPGTAIVIILQRPTVTLVQQLIDKGVRGILHINDDLEWHLAQAVHVVKQRGTHFSPGVSQFLSTQYRPTTTRSNRDLDVLKLLAEGLDPKEIAHHFGVCSNTIYRVLRVLRDKYNAHNNTQLIAIAQQNKLFVIETPE